MFFPLWETSTNVDAIVSGSIERSERLQRASSGNWLGAKFSGDAITWRQACLCPAPVIWRQKQRVRPNTYKWPVGCWRAPLEKVAHANSVFRAKPKDRVHRLYTTRKTFGRSSDLGRNRRADFSLPPEDLQPSIPSFWTGVLIDSG